MGKGVGYDTPVRRYQGPKTVLMPENCSKKNVLPLKVLCSAIIAEKRAKELDTDFSTGYHTRGIELSRVQWIQHADHKRGGSGNETQDTGCVSPPY